MTFGKLNWEKLGDELDDVSVVRNRSIPAKIHCDILQRFSARDIRTSMMESNVCLKQCIAQLEFRTVIALALTVPGFCILNFELKPAQHIARPFRVLPFAFCLLPFAFYLLTFPFDFYLLIRF